MKTTRNTQLDLRIMKTSWVVAALFLLLGLGGTPAFSQDDHSHSGEAQEQEAKKTEIPKTLPGVWSEITEHQEALHGILKANELESVHHVAFSIRDYVEALPGKSKLTGEKKKLLKGYVVQVDTLAAELDEAGDAGDSTAVAALVGQLDMRLQGIEALYAAKDLKPPVSASATATAKQMYVCPMHPEITSEKPGDCSKCGMALVKKDH